MSCINKWAIAGLAWPMCVSAFAQQQIIEVFTEQPALIDSLPGAEVVRYDLSEPARVKSRSAPKFPADEKLALLQAKAFFNSDEGKAYQRAMRDAYRGQQKMMQYQLAKIPAVVFEDGKYVIYGITDVRQAVSLYQQHLRTTQE